MQAEHTSQRRYMGGGFPSRVDLSQISALMCDEELIAAYPRRVDQARYLGVSLRTLQRLVRVWSATGDSSDKRPWYVYLMRADRWIKVGITTDLQTRLSAIQVGCPMDVCVVALSSALSLDEATKVEAETHAKLQPHRVRGEWFLLAGESVAKASIEALAR